TLLRIWDCFLLEGPKVLFRFSLAILHLHSKEIILKCDTISVMRHLKTCAKITYDVDGLIWTAFKTLKPFPRRQDIVTKQLCYLNSLKEKYRFRDLQRASFVERENCYLAMEADADNYTGFESCVITRPGEAWVAYGEPPFAKICIVDCQAQIMTDTRIKFDSRVMSMAVAENDMVLIGTLAWDIYAYNQYTREMCWQQRVHDAVLSMQVYKEDDGECSNRLFAALADGTVAVFETITESCTNYDVLYLPIGQSPVTCLKLLGNQLWCACGNTVSIIHASTLDPMDRFTVSGNPYDTVLSLVPGLPGVWISVRGSSVLELWDPMSLSCKMLYDTRTGRYPNLRKEDDTYFNAARITSILAMDYSVWVGTGEGILTTFDVFLQNNRTPSDTSPFLTENPIVGSELGDSQSWKSSAFLSHASESESYTRLLEVERREKNLHHQQVATEEFHNLKNKMPETSFIDGKVESRNDASNNVDVNSVHAGPDLSVQDVHEVKLKHPLKLTERTESEDSVKSVDSDNVFPESKPSLKDPQVVRTSPTPETKNCPDSDFTHANYSSTDKDNLNDDVNIKQVTATENYSNKVYLNGDIDAGSDLSDDDSDTKQSNEALFDQHLLDQSGNVKALAAQFEGKAFRKDNDYIKFKMRRSQSLKMNFKPTTPSLCHIERLNETCMLSEEEEYTNPDIRKSIDNSEYVRSVLTVENPIGTNPDIVLPDESALIDTSCGSGENQSITENHKVQDYDSASKAEKQRAASQLRQELEDTKHVITSKISTSSEEIVMHSNYVNQLITTVGQSRPTMETLSTPEIDTRFYGDSDEDSCVHEARVQSFKDSYKRKSAAKFRSVNEVVQETITVASKDSGNSSIGTVDIHTGTESKQTAESSNSSDDSGNCSRKPSVSETSSISSPNSYSKIVRQNSDASLTFGNVQSHDLDAQWRLDYTNIHVDTDKDSPAMSTAGGDSDSLSPSRRLSCVSNSSDMKDQSVESRTSIASTLDMFYGADLSLMSKNKISDKPIKWLVATESQGKPIVISFAGSHSDDEAVLIWSRDANETLWTNCPVFEYNPATRKATLPRYMRTQMSAASSAHNSPKHRHSLNIF
ncbi:unnamed protein product, partial [Candidula unifasciata]